LCENGNAFPPHISSSEHESTPLNSKVLGSKDETWFAVDIDNGTIRGNAEELARAYENFYQAAKVRSMAFLHVNSVTASSQSRAWLLCPVQRGAVLHHLLCLASGGILRSIAPSLYLNADELAQFRRILCKARLAKSMVALVWVLVTSPDSYRIHHPHSAWLLNRLLRVESQLSIQLQEILKTTLVQFLLTDEIENLETSWLTPEQFRSAVMADLNFET
jgi:hypothetical protein